MEQIDKLYTKQDLLELLAQLGIQKGMTVEVHASLSKFGYVVGGAQTFNDALIESVGYNGTIIMPLQMSDRGEPSKFSNPPIAFELQEIYRKGVPAFDKMNCETLFMSDIYDNLRRRAKAEISNHPVLPFVAYGKYARNLCSMGEGIDEALGEKSPLSKLFSLKAFCLLANVDYDCMTCLHLSEYRSHVRPYVVEGTSLATADDKEWVKYLELELDSDDGFMEIGKRLEMKNQVRQLSKDGLLLKLVRIDTAVNEGVSFYRDRYRYYRGDMG